MCVQKSVLLTEVTKSIISHTLSPTPPCTQLIHGGMDSLGVALFLTARWAGLMWPTPSETLLIAAGSRRPKKTVHWTATASWERCGWRALTVLMKWVYLDWARVQRCYRDPRSDCGCLTRCCRSAWYNNTVLVSKKTAGPELMHLWRTLQDNEANKGFVFWVLVFRHFRKHIIPFVAEMEERRLQPSRQNKFSVVNVSGNHWCVHLCTCHRLCNILTLPQTTSYHIHITCLWFDFHVGRWRGCCWSYRWEASNSSSSLRSTFVWTSVKPPNNFNFQSCPWQTKQIS